MACRCGDKEKMKRDLQILYTISDKVDILIRQDENIGNDLTHLSNLCDASFITKTGFAYKLKTLKGTATTDIASLKTKVDSLIEQVNNDYNSAKSEDDTYHREQLLKFLGIG